MVFYHFFKPFLDNEESPADVACSLLANSCNFIEGVTMIVAGELASNIVLEFAFHPVYGDILLR